jgi:hypothetical protein
MRRLLLSLATAAVLTGSVVPAALAADPTADPVATAAPPDAAPTDGVPQPTATPGPYDGTVVEDPTFVSGGELPTQPPGAATTPGAPGLTPPPTDARVAAPMARSGSQLPLILLVASAVAALVASPVRRARRLPRTSRTPRRHRQS